MTIGYTAKTNAANINDRVGQIIIQLREALEDINQFKKYVDLMYPNDTAGNNALKVFMTYDDNDVTLFRAIVTDLENLRLTAVGLRAQPGASNFFFNADKAVGFH